MKLLKFEKNNCQGCILSSNFMEEIGFDKSLMEVVRPYDEAEDAEKAMEYGVMAMPTFLVVDSDKTIVKRLNGYDPSKANELRSLLDFFLENK